MIVKGALILFYFGTVMFCLITVVKSQVGVTNCSPLNATSCSAIPNSYCSGGTGKCECYSILGYVSDATGSSCVYKCTNLTAPADGSVSTPSGTFAGAVATYSCNAGFSLNGVTARTCVDTTGWSDAAPTCVKGKLGANCTTTTDLCVNIVNGHCSGGLCTCKAGYHDDGTTYNCSDINECLSTPCLNGATCNNLVNNYTCTCVAGYTGSNCETEIDECASSPCQHGATCINALNKFTCACVAGYTDVTCATNINECLSNPCQHGGSCTDDINKYSCTCVAGYNGNNCETNINECVSSPCNNGGTCVDGINQYTCTCVTGYTDLSCSTNINDCINSPCSNGGTCIDLVNAYSCACVLGYTGTVCQTNINECNGNACQNGATCIDGINNYTCVCLPGFTGWYCQTNINECVSSPCLNGATCIDGFNAFVCSCVPGYTGTICDTNINECATNPCGNGGTCKDGINHYNCTCAAGYTDTDCQTNINECLTNACQNGATCVDGINSYICVCAAGYTGQYCATELNECTLGGNVDCQNGATCSDKVNGYLCICAAGYTNTYCQTNINDCITNACTNGATCVDGLNTYSCSCASGFNGIYCATNVDECVTNNCQNGATCIDGVNTYTCTCRTGFTGTLCETNINDCSTNPCLNSAECTDAINNYTCTCLAGYNGKNCQNNIDECASSPCINGGTCNDGINKYTCTCVAGYTGNMCLTNINECSSNPCVNGGACSDGINMYTCACVTGFTGLSCTTNINECIANLCSNGATCVDGINMYTCLCMPGYNDIYCQTNINDCIGNVCQNAATCIDGINKYTCMCVTGFTGTFCETNINDCSPNPCQNAGLCTDAINDYNCSCMAGYNGKICQNNIDECASSPCIHGGTCNDGINKYTCTCVAGYTDSTCATDINDCSTSPCQNGGFCTDGINLYTCTCVAGYTGITCATNIDECVGSLCSNGATCVDGVNIYSCICVNGYNGTHCDNNINECINNPCQNGATCIDGVNKYTCTCVNGFTGTLCENNINDCSPNPCQNNGACTDALHDYNCSCMPGYNGKNCQDNIDECSSSPCYNGGACNDGINKYTCSCASGYTSLTCQTDINECSSNPCQNGGTCMDGIDMYTCVCVTGFTGLTCTTNINECTNSLCQNGATCVDGINNYTCNCAGGYDGFFCASNINECLTNQCQNGASCMDKINMYTCICAAGYTGTLCETNNNDCASAPCANGGTCTDLLNAFQCACANGYTDVMCRPAVLGDDCSTRAGVCANLLYAHCNGSNCACQSGYEKAGVNCVPVDCGSLPNPDNGLVDLTTEGTKYQNKVFFSCNAGYTRSGSSFLTCQATKLWSGVSPTCARIDCGSLMAPLHGSVAYNPGTKYLDQAEFTCSTGYTLSGSSSRTCAATGVWSDTSPLCTINVCPVLSNPNYGSVDMTPGNSYQSTVTFSCNPGYYLTGITSLTCQADGNWNGSKPICVIRDCGVLSAPSYGTITLPSTYYLSVATFTCDIGYARTGPASVLCGSNGLWSDVPPTCSLKDCGVLISPDNGQVNLNTGTKYLATATYTCNLGFTLSGFVTRQCQSDGNWTNTAPTCIKKDCGILATPNNGAINFTEGTMYGSITKFTCFDGYTLNGDTTRLCDATGSWSGSSPTCVIKDCLALTNPIYGEVHTFYGTKYGAIATYVCNMGYQINGVATRTCLASGLWDAEPASCSIKDCGPVAIPTHGSVSYSNGTLYGSTVTYSCTHGYMVWGVSARLCQASGTWDNSQPNCTLLDCLTPPTLSNGYWYLPQGSQVGAVVIYYCNSGYGISGNANVTCGPSGFWGAVPQCLIDCGIPPSIDSGTWILGVDTLVGNKATYVCNNGYSLSGTATIECQTTGKWTTGPFCFIALRPYNQTCSVTAQCVTMNSTCRDNGQASLRCLCALTRQYYDANIDQCLADCGGLPSPTNGAVVFPAITSTGQVATYSCDNGYALSGSMKRTCLPSGSWSDTAPICVSGCPYPTAPANGMVNVSEGLAAGATITYSCYLGYALVGETQRVCLTDSTWNANAPTCYIACPQLNDISHGIVDTSEGTWEGSTVTYICQKDYALTGTSTRTCQSTGHWNGIEPECIFAIFPDVLLVFGSLFILLVLIDLFILAFCLYKKYGPSKKENLPGNKFDSIDEKKDKARKDKNEDRKGRHHNYPQTLQEEKEMGVPPASFLHKTKQRDQNKVSENHETKVVPEEVNMRREILREPSHPPPKKIRDKIRDHRENSSLRDTRHLFQGYKRSKPGYEPPIIPAMVPQVSTDGNTFLSTVNNEPPPSSLQQQAMKELRTETTHDITVEEIKDGYNTGNSDDVHQKQPSIPEDEQFDLITNIHLPDSDRTDHFDLTKYDRKSLPDASRIDRFDLTKEDWKPLPETERNGRFGRTKHDSKPNIFEEAQMRFKARLPIPPITDTQAVPVDKNTKPYTDDSRKILKNTVNTYSPTQKLI